jgi:hypothetical protein
MSSTLAVDRFPVCAFLSPGGRGCTMPLSSAHPFLCTYHARKEAQASAAQKVGQDIAYSLNARYISHNDLSAALAQCISAVAQRQLTSRTASTIANLSRTLLHSVAGAQNEYITAYGEDAWREKIAENLCTLRPPKPGETLRDDLLASDEDGDERIDDPPAGAHDAINQDQDATTKTPDENPSAGESEDQHENAEEQDCEEEDQYDDQAPPPDRITNYWATLKPTTNPPPAPKWETA